MYIGTQYQWPGNYLIGVAFGIVGVAACLVVTLLPSWWRKPAEASDASPTPDTPERPAHDLRPVV